MATVEFRGYVSRPEAKTSKAGKAYSKFAVGVKQKEKAFGDRPEEVTWANFYVTDFNNASPPPEKSYVTVKGFLKVREYEKDGRNRTALDVTAQELDVAEPLQPLTDPTAKTDPKTKTGTGSGKDPWE